MTSSPRPAFSGSSSMPLSPTPSILAKIDTLKDEVVLMVHSLVCLMVAHWSGHANGRVHGALMVSVPDPDSPNFPSGAKNFGGLPMQRFPFKSLVVSSDNDPYGSQEYMKRCADAWGSKFVAVSGLGHINADNGLGSWMHGKESLWRVTG